MLGNIGIPGLILILIALLLVFGPSKLPEIGRAFGKGLREFKDATKGIMDDQDAGRGNGSAGAQQNQRATVEPIELNSESKRDADLRESHRTD
ncbi:hypothetical protein GCM10025857_17130 [Alicyclobacillus contaminans]|uniref:twin-arginine translocase TatA/TatE family subunit n=1 Tax=Alicyclobacillus contaminans TaxID=392016 RepID=UPI0004186F93|nr:twin-arginine translocase TatA/TatE family subunit [Alicyclobacillus contaminans]GMA50356.1 hypothetical protein GCM10025857_17130 [Alicyclobacillus contaminans]